jgi:hypothetical protein
VKCVDCQKVINEIARQHDLSRGTLRNIKSLLSSVFVKLAKQQGFFDGENPHKDASILKGRKRGEVYTYTLEERWRFILALCLITIDRMRCVFRA